jgi:hypothetical protein
VRFRTGTELIGGSVQSESVTALVGAEGENLTGNKVEELRTGTKVLVASQVVDLPLVIELPVYPQLDASTYADGTPERALVEYLLAWQNQDWERMAMFTQKTWQSVQDDPAEELMWWHDFKGLLGAELGEKEVISEGFTVRITVEVYYAVSRTWIEHVIIRPMIIRESAPFEPSRSGDWGINPISTLDEVKVED